MRQVVCVCSEHRLGSRATNLPGQFLLLSECRRCSHSRTGRDLLSRLSEHANNASLKTNKVTLDFRELLLYILLLLLVLRQLPCRDDLFLLQSFPPHNPSLVSGTRGGLSE